MPRVPVENETRNILECHVIGNKTDDAVSVVGSTQNSLVALLKGLHGSSVFGVTDIDVSAADYTGYVTILTITPQSGNLLYDLTVDLDLNKATTGWDTVSTAADTIDIAAFVKIDGTNARPVVSATQAVAEGDGSLVLSGRRLSLGVVDQVVEIKAKLSAERADVEIPYRVKWRGGTPTVTAVAAG